MHRALFASDEEVQTVAGYANSARLQRGWHQVGKNLERRHVNSV